MNDWLGRAAMTLIALAIVGAFLMATVYTLVNRPDSDLATVLATTLTGAVGMVLAFFFTKQTPGE